MSKLLKIAVAAALLGMPAYLVAAPQNRANPSDVAGPVLHYADYADLVVDAPVIVDATVRSQLRLKPVDAPDLPPTIARLYVEADVGALIRGSNAVPPRIGYTLDVPLDAHGRVPSYRKARVLLFARAVSGNAGQVQLVRPDGQRSWTPAGDALTRRIVREVLAPDAPPTITGVGNAVHTAGDLPGSGQTQIFLTTVDNRPISFDIERKPDQPPHWVVALGEVVDQSAPPPARDTLLWYRLACTLPAALPDSSVPQDGDDAAIAREDYALVVRELGACERGGRR
ncbi:hypothetical protein [Sphingomonas sp. PAMC 26605]|uniref:hypothetical protein n=1 Tax=Sphingomonas sp. PAMC 26605 TaxID=1112214 RepID=UPI00026CCB43|nr:hypothetical protein [Sphingomonas sp. PAMC 26605]